LNCFNPSSSGKWDERGKKKEEGRGEKNKNFKIKK